MSGVFFSYFGGKFMRAPHYPSPRHAVTVEPFAGAAGYSVRHRLGGKAILVDASPYVSGVWRFLIGSSRDDILRLPLMESGQNVDSLPVCQEARWLIGFWINQGSGVPKKTMGGRASNRQFGTWGEAPRQRIATQVDLIRDWQIIEGDYRDAPDIEATWFIDPPYSAHPNHYAAKLTDYASLAGWARQRRGQVMVCETTGADWLPFRPITKVVGSSHRVTQEMLWEPQTDLDLFGEAA